MKDFTLGTSADKKNAIGTYCGKIVDYFHTVKPLVDYLNVAIND
jgi:hypothetical protein